MKSNLPATKADLEKFIRKTDFKTLLAKLATKEDMKTFEKNLIEEIRFTANETKKEIIKEIKQTENNILNVLNSFLGAKIEL